MEISYSNYGQSADVNLVDDSRGYPVYFSESCTSTMDLASALNSRGVFPEWASVSTGIQTGGRGQFGREWISVPGNLYFSVRVPGNNRLSPMASCVAALAVNIALKAFNVRCEFKWPNDILFTGKKVGGILVEDKSGVLITGMGLNLSISPSTEKMRDSFASEPGHLGESGVIIPPLELLKIIVDEMRSLWSIHENSKSFKGIILELEKIMAFRGDRVVFSPAGRPCIPAVISGLSDNGGIRLITADGEKHFLSGSFSPVVH
jgi:BirA family biotin operon repressor/biotin-[acetyl-CoA-carboxylase] ligase